MTDTPAPTPVLGRPGLAYEAAEVRRATVADAPQLAALWRLAYPDESVDDMAAWLEHGGALALRDRSGRILAALRWREEGDGWRVDRVATRPDERGQGYGRWLATMVEAMAIRQNVPYLLLSLPADDPEPIAYYRRMGYREAPTDPGPDAGDAGATGPLTLRKAVGGVWQRKSADTSAAPRRETGTPAPGAT